MSVRRFAVSFDPDLAEKVRTVSGGNISAWLADAARRKLRNLALAEAVQRFEDEHGAITEEELTEVRREWSA